MRNTTPLALESFCEQVNVDGILKDKIHPSDPARGRTGNDRRSNRGRLSGAQSGSPLCISLANRTNATSGAVKRTMNMPRTSVKNYRMDLRRYKLNPGAQAVTSVYQAVKLIKPCARTLPLLSNPSKPCSMITPICFGNAFPRDLSIRKTAEAMHPESRAQSSVGRLHSIGRLLSFCSSGTRQTASAG